MSNNKKLSIFIFSFLIGVFIAPDFPFDEQVLFMVFLILFILFFIFRKDGIVRIVALSSIFLIFGFWIFYLYIPNFTESHIFNFAKQEVEIDGYISNYPVKKERNQTFVLESSKVKINGVLKNTNGKVMITTISSYDFSYGQNLKVKGELDNIENSENFKLSGYYASKNIYTKMFFPKVSKSEGKSGNFLYNFLFGIKSSFQRMVELVFIEPSSSFFSGILLGIKNLPNRTMEIFNIVAISHIIVVSGYNVSIVADFFKKSLSNFSRRLSFWLPLIAIFMFGILTGGEAPVIRACIMASLILIAKSQGRKANGVFLILLASFLMVLVNPFILRYDPGFQLSVLATLGLILISDNIFKFLKNLKMPVVLSEALASTLAAQIFILPVIIFYFQRLSLVSPIVNLLVLPIIPLIMLSSFAITLVGFVNIDFARLLSFFPVFLSSYVFNISEVFSKIKYASINIEKSYFLIFAYYSFLTIPFIKKFKKKINFNEKAS